MALAPEQAAVVDAQVLKFLAERLTGPSPSPFALDEVAAGLSGSAHKGDLIQSIGRLTEAGQVAPLGRHYEMRYFALTDAGRKAAGVIDPYPQLTTALEAVERERLTGNGSRELNGALVGVLKSHGLQAVRDAGVAARLRLEVALNSDLAGQLVKAVNEPRVFGVVNWLQSAGNTDVVMLAATGGFLRSTGAASAGPAFA